MWRGWGDADGLSWRCRASERSVGCWSGTGRQRVLAWSGTRSLGRYRIRRRADGWHRQGRAARDPRGLMPWRWAGWCRRADSRNGDGTGSGDVGNRGRFVGRHWHRTATRRWDRRFAGACNDRLGRDRRGGSEGAGWPGGSSRQPDQAARRRLRWNWLRVGQRCRRSVSFSGLRLGVRRWGPSRRRHESGNAVGGRNGPERRGRQWRVGWQSRIDGAGSLRSRVCLVERGFGLGLRWRRGRDFRRWRLRLRAVEPAWRG